MIFLKKIKMGIEGNFYFWFMPTFVFSQRNQKQKNKKNSLKLFDLKKYIIHNSSDCVGIWMKNFWKEFLLTKCFLLFSHRNQKQKNKKEQQPQIINTTTSTATTGTATSATAASSDVTDFSGKVSQKIRLDLKVS